MLKIITGAPRSGKTFFAVRHVLLTYFRWDAELFEWVSKDDKQIPFILTNIDGLLVPHENITQFLKDQDCSLPEFLTLERIVPFIEKQGRPFVLILDEAHGTFPYQFKDHYATQPEKSVLYFFGYHGHYPIDLYLIVQSWGDLNQTIAGKAEYQIEAERRSTSMVGEFKYKYMHPKTMEVMNTQIVKPDSKIFMAYKSSSGGEYKTNEIKPYRKFVYIAVFLVILVAVLLWRLQGLYFHDDTRKSKTQNNHIGLTVPDPALFNTKNETITNKLPLKSSSVLYPEGLAKPEQVIKSYVTVSLGGAWIGQRAIAVDLFGDLVMLRDLPYSYSLDMQNHRINVRFPDDVVGSIRPGLWVDSSRIIATLDDDESEDDNNDSEVAPNDRVDNVVDSRKYKFN